MKKTVLILTFIIGSFTIANAQKMGRERIKAFKATYITNAISLNSSEAEKFWPVYNEYSDKINSLKRNMENGARKFNQINSNVDQLSNKEAESMLEKRIKLEEHILNLKISQIKELKKIISAKKILKLQKAERDFNRELLKEYGKRRGMKRGQ